MAILIYSMFALLVLTHTAHGSGVVLQQNPDVIQTILTQEMTMQCSINDTGVGQDLRFVTSLIISRNGTEVASITPFSPLVDSHVDMGKMNASGSVSMQGGVQGYLRLTWTYPDAGQAGDYTCEVNGVNSVGHPISYTTTVNIPVREPTLSDITAFVSDQQKILDKHKGDNKFLMAKNSQHKADLSVLHMEMNVQQQEMDSVNVTANQIENKMATIMTMLDETRQVDDGTVVCGDSNTWTDVGTFREVEVTTDFARPYGNAPIVHVSPSHINNYNNNVYFKNDVKFWIDLTEINAYNFTVRCRTDGSVSTSYFRMEELDVSWFSIGQYQ